MICDEGISTLTQWKRQLLDGVDLSSPDGRPLYTYRLTAAQFDLLETVLRDQIQLFESFPELKRRYWGRHFWARGYFCITPGELTEEMIKEYLEHYFEPRVVEFSEKNINLLTRVPIQYRWVVDYRACLQQNRC